MAKRKNNPRKVPKERIWHHKGHTHKARDNERRADWVRMIDRMEEEKKYKGMAEKTLKVEWLWNDGTIHDTPEPK